MYENIALLDSTIESIEENSDETKRLFKRLRGKGVETNRFSEGNVWIYDLLNPKRAYFRAKYPEVDKKIPLERRELMWASTEFHKEFGYVVSPKVFRERLIRVSGIAGRIDIFLAHPVEIKKSMRPLKSDFKPYQTNIEQLGMYCALTNISDGHLIYYSDANGGNLIIFKIIFSDIKPIFDEMLYRKDLLLQAWRDETPEILPRCPWYPNCECASAQVCDCKSTEKPFRYTIAERAKNIIKLDEESRKLFTLFQKRLSTPRIRFTLYDVLMPRLYCYKLEDRAEKLDIDEYEQPSSYTLQKGIRNEILLGGKDEFLRYYGEFMVHRFPMVTHNDTPAVICVPECNRDWIKNKYFFAKYLNKDLTVLGMQCAVTNSTNGRMFVYYYKESDESAKVCVYDIKFRNLDVYKKYLENQLSVIENFRTTGSIENIEFCPSWKCRRCKYVSVCKPKI
jgi:hypothetical protein